MRTFFTSRRRRSFFYGLVPTAHDLTDLLLHPRERRVGGDVDMDDAPEADLHDDENVGDGEEDCPQAGEQR
jgi:hypothetical protein